MNGRNKGAAFERLIAGFIEEATGHKPQRNLEQYRAREQGDLIGVPGWAIECKHYKEGWWPKDKWWEQTVASARAAGCKPALVYRYNRQPIRVMLRIPDLFGDGTVFVHGENGSLFVDRDVAVVSLDAWLRLL